MYVPSFPTVGGCVKKMIYGEYVSKLKHAQHFEERELCNCRVFQSCGRKVVTRFVFW